MVELGQFHSETGRANGGRGSMANLSATNYTDHRRNIGEKAMKIM